jgi:hypothetical protein
MASKRDETNQPGMKWWIGWVECGSCKSEQRSKIEIDIEHDEPIIPLECAKCGSMACVAIYDDRR